MKKIFLLTALLTYNSVFAAGQMDARKAQAIVEATNDEVADCRSKVEKYLTDEPEKVIPCLEKISDIFEDGSDFETAGQYLTSMTKEEIDDMSIEDLQKILDSIKEIDKNEEYIAHRLERWVK